MVVSALLDQVNYVQDQSYFSVIIKQAICSGFELDRSIEYARVMNNTLDDFIHLVMNLMILPITLPM